MPARHHEVASIFIDIDVLAGQQVLEARGLALSGLMECRLARPCKRPGGSAVGMRRRGSKRRAQLLTPRGSFLASDLLGIEDSLQRVGRLSVSRRSGGGGSCR